MFQVSRSESMNRRSRSHVAHRVGRSDEGEGRDPHLVARLHAVQEQRQVQRRGAAGRGRRPPRRHRTSTTSASKPSTSAPSVVIQLESNAAIRRARSSELMSGGER